MLVAFCIYILTVITSSLISLNFRIDYADFTNVAVLFVNIVDVFTDLSFAFELNRKGDELW